MGSDIPTALQEQMDQLQTALQEDTANPGGELPGLAQKPSGEDVTGNRHAAAGGQEPPREQELSAGAQRLGNTVAAPQDEGQQDWRHKYEVINGKYIHETGRLRQDLAAAQSELDALRSQDRQPQREAGDLPTATDGSVQIGAVGDDEVQRLVSQGMIDEFGTDYWKQQIALLRAMQPQQSERIQQVESRLDDQSRRGFYADLSSLVPSWEQTNNSPEWNEFLGQVEPLTGTTYEQLLMDAYNRYDSIRVAEMFKRFGGTSQPKGGGPSIDSQAMPSGRSAPDTVPQGQTMTIDEWNRQLEGLTSGGLTPMQVHEKKKALMTAWTQGRVTGATGPENRAPSFV